jgi:CheY-like chemotaxis protein
VRKAEKTVDAMQHARLLLVDDAARSVRLLAKMLSEDGYVVDICYDGDCAITKLERGPLPNLVITDLLMPGAHGLSVMRKARELNAFMPVVLITGYPELLPMALDELGPAPVVHPKPIDYVVLQSQVHALVQP